MAHFLRINENLSLVISQIQDKEVKRKESESFDSKLFWAQIDGAVKQISSESTKLCLAFSQPPLPDNECCRQLVERVEKATLVLVSTFYGLPDSQGLYICQSTRESVLSIIEAIQKLTLIIAEDAKSGSLTQVQCTGGIWEQCDNFPRTPHSNKDAVHVVAKQTAALVSDALTELEEAQNEADDDDFGDIDPENNLDLGSWSEHDKKMLAPCTGLIKATKSSLKKISSSIKSNGSCDCLENIKELDSVADRLKMLSPHVDDFAVTLYPPMNRDYILQEGEKLYSCLRDILQSLKGTHFVTETDMNWIEFLLKASHHNWQKIQNDSSVS